MAFRLSRRGRYTGRLAFDPETGFHTDPAGRKVVTDDEGRTWRYAKKSDASHLARYQRRLVTVDSTTGDDPHHYTVHASDAHHSGIVFHPDVDSPFQTSHTEAYQ